MKNLHKLILKLGILILLLIINSVDSTWNDAEGGTIPVQTDTLSWPQIGLVKTVFSLLVILWFYGMLPIAVAVPLNHFVEGRSLKDNTECLMICKLMSSVTTEPEPQRKF